MEAEPTSPPVEDIMFHTKSRTEQLKEQVQDQSESLASTAAAVADQLRERVGPAVGQATENAMEWARPRVGHGIEVAAPRLESAVSGLAPKVDTARDKIVDELIPRIAEAISVWAAASAVTKNEAVSRGQGAASVISGSAVASPKGRKKRVLLMLGLVGAAGAAAIALMKKSAPKDDPWTTPLADPYGSTPNGRHSASPPADKATTTTTTGPETSLVDSLDEAAKPTPMEPAADTDVTDKNLADGEPTDKDASKDLTVKNSTKKNGANKNGTDKSPLT
jgi:hypothetical protein